MQKVAGLFLVACCALTALSLAEDTNGAKLPSTMSSAEAFDESSPTTITTPTPKPTTTKAPPPKPTTTKAPPPKPTTTKAPPPKPTTTKAPPPKPTTTKAPPPKPTTTKAPPPKPTTTKAPPPKPTTTKSTTTAAPQPTPATNLTVGNYSLKTSKGDVCLKAQMALKIKLSTQKVNGTFIIQPRQTNTNGECKETKANLTLTFQQGFITFLFTKSVANNTAYLNAVSFSLSYPFTKSGTEKYNAKNESVHLFAAKIGNSYSCREESVFMGNGLSLEISSDRLQAFNVTKDEFGRPDPCPADQPDYRIAIAVGVTLLVLIVIVLIVYLLGRRKRTAGYQSL